MLFFKNIMKTKLLKILLRTSHVLIVWNCQPVVDPCLLFYCLHHTLTPGCSSCSDSGEQDQLLLNSFIFHVLPVSQWHWSEPWWSRSLGTSHKSLLFPGVHWSRRASSLSFASSLDLLVFSCPVIIQSFLSKFQENLRRARFCRSQCQWRTSQTLCLQRCSDSSRWLFFLLAALALLEWVCKDELLLSSCLSVQLVSQSRLKCYNLSHQESDLTVFLRSTFSFSLEASLLLDAPGSNIVFLLFGSELLELVFFLCLTPGLELRSDLQEN